jgi:hypothetical protein
MRYDGTLMGLRGTEVILRGKLPIWAVIGVIGAVGLGLIFLPNVFDWKWDHGVLRDIGIAALTAAFLGATIDRWLKSEIASDVFKAALGYILPDEFRDEVRRITSYKFICEYHFLIIEIEIIDKDCVRVTSMLERTIKNITSEVLPCKNYLAIDEWGFPQQKSEIIDCQIEIEGGPPLKFETVEQKGHYIEANTKEINVYPGVKAKLYSKFIEIKRQDDHITLVCRAPTSNPEIEVRIPPTLAYECSFGTADEKVNQSRYGFRHTLIGTYFPLQSMRLRWWPKEDAAAAPLDRPGS